MSNNTENENKTTKNRVAQIVENMGFRPIPTELQLMKLNMTQHRWTKILNNTVDLTGTELVNIANWLKVDIKDLFE